MSDQADRTEVLRASSAAFWRATAALSCVLLATHLMNYVVFPLYDPIMTEARSLSQVAQTAYFVIVGALATFAPKRLARLYPVPALKNRKRLATILHRVQHVLCA